MPVDAPVQVLIKVFQGGIVFDQGSLSPDDLDLVRDEFGQTGPIDQTCSEVLDHGPQLTDFLGEDEGCRVRFLQGSIEDFIRENGITVRVPIE